MKWEDRGIPPQGKGITWREFGQASLRIGWGHTKHLLSESKKLLGLRNHCGDFGFGKNGFGCLIANDSNILGINQVAVKLGLNLAGVYRVLTKSCYQ